VLITAITRRDIADALIGMGVRWSGRLDEPEFLSRLYALDEFPSNDSRFETARGDIVQHTVRNNDWSDSWVFYDDRFGLSSGDDDQFLNFLCETLHPMVRQDVGECSRLCSMYNELLIRDGFRLFESTVLSGHPVYAARYVGTVPNPGLAAAKDIIAVTDPAYTARQINRMEAAIATEPDLAIGTAKELVETVCKTILDARGVEYTNTESMPALVRKARSALSQTPEQIANQASTENAIAKILASLGGLASGLAEIRNLYGTGHGKTSGSATLEARHARLAAGAASALAVFLIESHNAQPV
jgi:hypothetical protein